MSEAMPKAKLDALDGLRGFAASFVVLHHMATNQLLPDHPLLMHGGMLVDTFFVISGFVMAYQYGHRLAGAHDVATFIRRRFARVWPLHAAILLVLIAPRLVALALHGAGDSQLLQVGGHHSIGSWIASLALIHGMGIYSYAVWNGPSWTISVEFFVYFVFSLCAMSNGKWLYRLSALLLAATALVLVASEMYLSIPLEFSFLRCLFGFFCGVIMFPVYRLSVRSEVVTRRRVIVAEAVLLVSAIWLLWLGGKSLATLLFVPTCALLTVALATRQGLLAQVLTIRPIQSLGAWSLGIYLLHIPALNILMRASPHVAYLGLNFTGAGWGWRESLIFLFGVTGLAALGHVFVEKPARDWIGGRRAPGPVLAAISSLRSPPEGRPV